MTAPCSELLYPAEFIKLESPSTQACWFDPLEDSRWDEFLLQHPRASIFHSSAWLKALSRTYGYTPTACTISADVQNLKSAIVFCRVQSWLTGRRLVSLPFSDHCEPLIDIAEDAQSLVHELEQEVRREQWRYIEIRPLEPFEINTSLSRSTVTYAFHQLDLRPNIDVLFRNFHKSSIQRKILRAAREDLNYREGSTEVLLDHFYELFKVMRKKHKLPPQPKKWFVNLRDCLGEAFKIRITYKDNQPIAAMITIRYKDTLIYKYGCSDPRFNNLGSMHLLFWVAIQEAKTSGLRFFDFGRTDAGQVGLITFKNRWGATQSTLTYLRYGVSANSTHLFDLPYMKWKSKAAKHLLSHVPASVLSIVGKMLYRHVG